MNKLLKNKADFNHKLGIKIYICSFTLLLIKLFPDLLNFIQNTHWGWFAINVGISYLYCLRRVISN